MPRYVPEPRSREVERLLTPEGVTIDFEISSYFERAAAFLIDVIIVFGFSLILAIATSAFTGQSFQFYRVIMFGGLHQPTLHLAVFLVVFFLLRIVYFPYCELKRFGMTFGKQKMGIQVVAKDGGLLTFDAIVMRNLMREVECFFPLSFLSITTDRGVYISALVWALIAATVPLWSKRQTRIGDRIAGTLVVVSPEAELVRDLAMGGDSGRESAQEKAATFSSQELSFYGIKELHTLEEILRDLSAESELIEHEVAKRIHQKLGRDYPTGLNDRRFLEQFYKAQRAYLEKRLLMGTRKEDKFDSAN